MYTDQDFVPIAKGPIYCARFCGFKCTKKAFDTATKKAAALAKRMGPGWVPRVWENAGWHYSVVDASGCWKVYGKNYGGDSYYSAYLGPQGGGGYWSASADTPEKAVKLVRKAAKPDLDLYRLIMEVA